MLDHRVCVDALTRRAGVQLSAGRLLTVYESAFNAVWRRGQATLGTVTMTAIVNRVIYNATEAHPVLAALTVGNEGIDCDELKQRLDRAEPATLAEGLRFVLLEWLTVIGNLTAEILTPALHEAVAAVPLDEGCPEPGPTPLEEQTHDT
jgi:hypothetical protein